METFKVKFEDRVYEVAGHHKWLAVDENGRLYSYDTEPFTVTSVGVWESDGEQYNLGSLCTTRTDWKTTLTEITEDIIVKDKPKEKTYRGTLTKDYILDKAISIKGEEVYKAEKLVKLLNISTPEISVSGDTMSLTYKDNGSGKLISLAGFCSKTLHSLSEVKILSVDLSSDTCKVLVRIPNE